MTHAQKNTANQTSKMVTENENGVVGTLSKIKQWIGWSWTYLWGFWFLLVVFLLYVLRTPLRLKENLDLGKYNSQ